MSERHFHCTWILNTKDKLDCETSSVSIDQNKFGDWIHKNNISISTEVILVCTKVEAAFVYRVLWYE